MRGVNGWYVGSTLHHYRCLTYYVPTTHKEQITDTIEVIPHMIPIPNSSIKLTLKSTANQLVRYLNIQPNLWSKNSADTTKALEHIAKLLHQDHEEPPKLVEDQPK